MGVSPFVYGPALVLGCLALLSVLGLGATEIIDSGVDNATWGTIHFSDNALPGDPGFNGFYDSGGNPVCYRNTTAVAGQEQGGISSISGLTWAFWRNSSGNYALFNDASQEKKATVGDTAQNWGSNNSLANWDMSLGTTLGLLAIIAGILAVGIIASVRVFGFGLSDVGINTLMKGGAYIMAWAIFSGLAMNLIVASGDLFTPIIYLALTGAYAFGVLGEIGAPSSG